MSQFEEIIDDVATRFGLGPKAGALLRELLLLVTGTPGGLGGFIDKLKSAGLAREIGGWLGNPNAAAAMSPSQVDQAFGSSVIDTIARKVGLSGATASAALGYLVPKLIGQLTPNGVIGAGVPKSISDFLRAPAAAGMPHVDQTMPPAGQAMPRADQTVRPRAGAATSAGSARWIAPLLALLAVLGIGWYLLAHRTSPLVEGTPTASAVPSRLAITNDNGVVTFSGTVHDETTRNSIVDTLKSVYGSNAVKGNITVDPNATPTPWLANLRGGLEQMKMSGLHAEFEGAALNLGGTVSDADRDRILASLKAIFGPVGLRFAALDRATSLANDAANKANAALDALHPGFHATDLLGILNKSIVNFPTGSAEIPAETRALLQKAAAAFKQLPAGTVIEINGYTDNTGDPAGNVQMSQRRADAVRSALIAFGVSPDMLTAKGYGSSNPVADNDTPEGRLKNRRIEYQVADRNRAATEGSGK